MLQYDARAQKRKRASKNRNIGTAVVNEARLTEPRKRQRDNPRPKHEPLLNRSARFSRVCVYYSSHASIPNRLSGGPFSPTTPKDESFVSCFFTFPAHPSNTRRARIVFRSARFSLISYQIKAPNRIECCASCVQSVAKRAAYTTRCWLKLPTQSNSALRRSLSRESEK